MAFDELKFRLLRRSGLTSDAAQIILEMGQTGGSGLTAAEVLAIVSGLPSTATVVESAGAPSGDTTGDSGISTTVSAPAGTPAGTYVYDSVTNIIYGPTIDTSGVVPIAAPSTNQSLVSPNGTLWTLGVDDTGHLITTSA